MIREEFYKNEKISSIELVDGESHTMHPKEFVSYVMSSKFGENQKDLLHKALENEYDIRVIGCYDKDVDELAKANSLEILDLQERTLRRPNKKFNRKRPVFCVLGKGKKGSLLWIVTFPSKEYVDQIAELTVSYSYLYLKGKGFKEENAKLKLKLIKCIHYPKLEIELSKWTGLDKALRYHINKGENVVIGHVEKLNEKLTKHRNFETVSEPKSIGLDDLYTVYTLREKDSLRRLVLIGFVHSYWGSASGLISRSLIKHGARSLFYIAKAGTLISPEVIKTGVSPTGYLLLDRNDIEDNWRVIKADVPIWPKNMKTLHADLDSGFHLTVPTVIGETYKQTDEYQRFKPATIDNEIGHIAREIHEHNEVHPDEEDVNFMCLHFITDFLHMKYETRKAETGLSAAIKESNRLELEERKSSFLHRASGILQMFTLLHGIVDTSVPNREEVEEYRKTIKRVLIGVLSDSIKLNPEADISMDFESSRTYTDSGKYSEALDHILLDKNFDELPFKSQLECIIVKQKYGLLDQARYDWSKSMKDLDEIRNSDEFLELQALEIKLNAQEEDYESIEEDCSILIQAYKIKNDISKIPSLYHRSAYAAFDRDDLKNSLEYIRLSQETSKDQNRHAYNTAEYLKIILPAFNDIGSVTIDRIDKLVQIQLNYLIEDTDPKYWQSNKLKSLLMVLFAEATLLYKIDSTRSKKLFCLSNYFMYYAGCNEYSEGFAELLFVIKDQRLRELVRQLMSLNYKDCKMFSEEWRIQDVLEIRDKLNSYTSIESKENLVLIRKNLGI